MTDRRGSTARATYTHPLPCWARHPIRSYVIICQFKQNVVRTVSIISCLGRFVWFGEEMINVFQDNFSYCAVFLWHQYPHMCKRWWEIFGIPEGWRTHLNKNYNTRTLQLLGTAIVMKLAFFVSFIELTFAKHSVSFHCYRYRYFRKCKLIANWLHNKRTKDDEPAFAFCSSHGTFLC